MNGMDFLFHCLHRFCSAWHLFSSSSSSFRFYSAFLSLSPVETWPALRFSPDDRFAARLCETDKLEVYKITSVASSAASPSSSSSSSSSVTFSLLDGKPLLQKGIEDFEWSPAVLPGSAGTSVLSFFTPEQGNIPARVVLLEIPTKSILRAHNMFNVAHVCYRPIIFII